MRGGATDTAHFGKEQKMTLPTRLLAGAAAILLSTGMAAAATVVASADLNLRSGPGIQYPVIAVIPDGLAVSATGCRADWCRVDFRGEVGWASAAYLSGAATVAPAYSYDYSSPYSYAPDYWLSMIGLGYGGYGYGLGYGGYGYGLGYGRYGYGLGYGGYGYHRHVHNFAGGHGFDGHGFHHLAMGHPKHFGHGFQHFTGAAHAFGHFGHGGAHNFAALHAGGGFGGHGASFAHAMGGGAHFGGGHRRG